MAKKKTETAPKAKGRTSAYSGKKIFKVVTENPHRAGTEQFNLFKQIKDGMTYEKFRELTGPRGRLYLANGIKASHLRIE